jgi:Fe-S cluster assembly iron-binding protein IscA
MVTVTDQAAEVLRATLDEARTDPSQALRLLPKSGGGLGLGLDQEREGDQVVTADGEKILLITPEIADAVGEATIDAQETEEGPRLVISRQ